MAANGEQHEAGLVKFRNRSNNILKSKSSNSLENEATESEIKIERLSELAFGDHIVISVDAQKYCHAIVDALNYEKSVLDVIYYDSSEAQCSLDEYMLNGPSCDLLAVRKNSTDSSKSSTDSKSDAKKEKDKEKKEKKAKKDKKEKNKNSCSQNGVKKSTLLIEFCKVEIYKVLYDPVKEPCLPAMETVEKARSFIGKEKYNIFLNNDEHFAIFCKTGKAAKLFVINPEDLTAKKLIGRDISDKIVVNLAQEGGQILLVSTAKHIATKFPRSAISAGLPAAAEVAGGMIGVAVEGFSTSYDIYQKHKELKEGKLSTIKFKKYVARRVTRGTMGVAGGVAGGIIGQLVIPIPVVGAVVGSLVGGIVGAAAGQGEGILIGELVEVIDNKIKEKKSEKLKKQGSKDSLDGLQSKEELIPEDKPKPEEIDVQKAETKELKVEPIVPKFEVIDKLVFKFDKDILKPEKWVHLRDVKIETLDEDKLGKIDPSEINILRSISRQDGAVVLENASQLINDDDYEIYVLNDSKEVITKLNVESAFDESGAISKRRSIENFSADVLPSNINVFFKIDEETDE